MIESRQQVKTPGSNKDWHANMVLQNTIAFREELEWGSQIKAYPSTTLVAQTLALGDISQAH